MPRAEVGLKGRTLLSAPQTHRPHWSLRRCSNSRCAIRRGTARRERQAPFQRKKELSGDSQNKLAAMLEALPVGFDKVNEISHREGQQQGAGSHFLPSTELPLQTLITRDTSSPGLSAVAAVSSSSSVTRSFLPDFL